MDRNWVIVQSHYPKGSSKLYEEVLSDLFTQDAAESRARMLKRGSIRFGFKARQATAEEFEELTAIEARRAATAHLWTKVE